MLTVLPTMFPTTEPGSAIPARPFAIRLIGIKIPVTAKMWAIGRLRTIGKMKATMVAQMDIPTLSI